MNFARFIELVKSMFESVKNVAYRFEHDEEKGKFMAYVSAGTDKLRILGKPTGDRFYIRWGSGHQSCVMI